MNTVEFVVDKLISIKDKYPDTIIHLTWSTKLKEKYRSVNTDDWVREYELVPSITIT